MKRLIGFSLLIMLMSVLIASGCGGGAPTAPTPVKEVLPTSLEIVIKDDGFKPYVVDVAQGGTVTWVNQDTVAHNVDSRNGIFNSGPIASGASWSYTFTEKGIYEYEDRTSPWLMAKVIVKEVATK